MKTKNNVQKTVFRFFAVVVTFVLISFTVSAQNFWKVLLKNSSFNEIAMALTDNVRGDVTHSEKDALSSRSGKALNSEVSSSVKRLASDTDGDFPLVPVWEEEQELEDWMLDESFWAI